MKNLTTRDARSKLKKQHNPHWRKVHKGLMVGYRRANTSAGVFYARWLGEDGKYHQKSLGIADDDPGTGVPYEDALKGALALDMHAVGEPTTTTVKRVMEDYLAWFQVERKSSDNTRSVINAHILPRLGKVDVSALTKKRIQAWKEALVTAPVRRRSGVPVSVDLDDREAKRARKATANRILGVLKAALERAHDSTPFPNPEAWRDVNPYKGVGVSRNRHLSHAESMRLINTSDPYFKQIVRGALTTGARYGELARAVVNDYRQDSGTLFLHDPKSGGPHHIQLSADGRKFFQKLVRGRAGDEPLFECDDGARWGKGMQTRRMKDACARVGIEPPLRFHELKHTYCSLALAAGMTMWQLSKNTGTSMATLERHYGHLADAELKRAVEAAIPSFGEPDSKVRDIG